MGSSSRHLTVILAVVVFSIISDSGVCQADWILFGKTEDADLYYNQEDITRSPSGTVTLWSKQVYPKRGVEDMVTRSGTRFDQLDHSIHLSEFDCLGKMVLSLSMVYFSKSGTVLEIREPVHQWEFVSPGSTFDRLYNKACS